MCIRDSASPAHHSKSPAMHNTAFEQLGLDSVYLAFDIKSEELKDTIAGFKAMKVRGANVSMPHKQNIIPYLDEISTASRLCNAVNTITFKDGKYYGTITDGIGFTRSLEEQGWLIKDKKITMVGAGGASTAIMVQLLSLIHILDQFTVKTSALFDHCSIFTNNVMPTKNNICGTFAITGITINIATN